MWRIRFSGWKSPLLQNGANTLFVHSLVKRNIWSSWILMVLCMEILLLGVVSNSIALASCIAAITSLDWPWGIHYSLYVNCCRCFCWCLWFFMLSKVFGVKRDPEYFIYFFISGVCVESLLYFNFTSIKKMLYVYTFLSKNATYEALRCWWPSCIWSSTIWEWCCIPFPCSCVQPLLYGTGVIHYQLYNNCCVGVLEMSY